MQHSADLRIARPRRAHSRKLEQLERVIRRAVVLLHVTRGGEGLGHPIRAALGMIECPVHVPATVVGQSHIAGCPPGEPVGIRHRVAHALANHAGALSVQQPLAGGSRSRQGLPRRHPARLTVEQAEACGGLLEHRHIGHAEPRGQRRRHIESGVRRSPNPLPSTRGRRQRRRHIESGVRRAAR